MLNVHSWFMMNTGGENLLVSDLQQGKVCEGDNNDIYHSGGKGHLFYTSTRSGCSGLSYSTHLVLSLINTVFSEDKGKSNLFQNINIIYCRFSIFTISLHSCIVGGSGSSQRLLSAFLPAHVKMANKYPSGHLSWKSAHVTYV